MNKNSLNRYFIVSVTLIIQLLSNSCTNAKKESSQKNIDDKPLVQKLDKKLSEIEMSMKNQGLVNIQEIEADILVDLKYSSLDNFFGEDVYGSFEEAYLQKQPAIALREANLALKTSHPSLRLLVYDATRPQNIQTILWNKLDSIPPRKRKDFVADPKDGSIHSYGCAIDLTIFDLKSNQALDMGTKYDYFGFLAYPRLEEEMLKKGKLSVDQISNRKLLRDIMNKAGFESITSEWWHFNYYSRKKAKEYYKIIE